VSVDVAAGEGIMKLLRLASYLSLVLMACSVGSVAAEEHEDARALALGDSVVFGFITEAGHEYVNASNFIGSPEYLAGMLDLDVANAGCPGEATSSFLSSTGADNGCRAFRGTFPLHVAYSSTQMAFATSFLMRHRQVRLVTIGIGANDLFILQDACARSPNPQLCFEAGLPALLATVAANMATILAELRATGFGGVIVIANYYSLDYSDRAGTGLTELLNGAIIAPAKAYGAVVADVFTAFQTVVANSAVGGKTCNAGLLNVDPQDQSLCDVHPSQSGQRLIAKTITGAFSAATR
jgi:lysophospholipase L1-like esterase